MSPGIGQQIGHALVRGPLALFRLRWRGVAWLVVYLALCAAVLAAVAHLLLTRKGDLEDALAAYLLPGSWRSAGTLLLERFFAAQERAVLVNAAVGGSLVVVQVLLFPVKEWLSAAVEREQRLTTDPIKEHPLWFQAWEEIKLFLAFLAAQASIFWLGYSSDPGRQQAAMLLSYAYLFASFGIDFLTPVLQRHEQRYSTMLKTLALHPVMVLLFGALFTLPTVLVARVVQAHASLSLATAMTAIFAVNVVCIAWGAVAGTWCGAQLLPAARRTTRPAAITRLAAWGVLLALLAWNGYRFGVVGVALHHKSQILKCHYGLDWSSVRLDTPSLVGGLIGAVASDTVEVGVRADVTIENPTAVDVVLEQNRLEITNAGQRVATASLTPVRIPAGGKVAQPMAFPLRLTPSQIARGRDLFRAGHWAVTLYLEVDDGFELPIYLLEADPDARP